VRFIPIAVIIGFTNGIAILIGLSQIKDFFGLKIEKMPAQFFQALQTLYQAADTVNPVALALACASLVVLVIWKTSRQHLGWLAHIPGTVVAMVLATIATTLLNLPVDTIGSRFGGVPSGLPHFEWFPISWDTAQYMVAPALTLALLGAIESLLCARIADGLMHDRHDSNQELMGQGIANLVTPFFGGMPATGTIARTVTNVKNGATTPVAGVVHALTLLVIILVAAPLAGHIPLAALSAILMFVAWNMGEWREFVHLRQFRLPYRVTLLAVFLLTVIVDLTVAVEVGLFAACLTFIYRISNLTHSEAVTPQTHPILQDQAPGVKAYRFYGALFFGAVKLIEAMEDDLPEHTLVLDLKNLIYVDSSGADALMALVRTCHKRHLRLILCGMAQQPLDMARRSGLLEAVPEADRPEDLAAGLALACQP
jgi:SulP family sulfate permease